MAEELVKCTGCKMMWRLDGFDIDRLGRRRKTCLRCKERRDANREKVKCEHNRQRYQCLDCGGSSICEHNRQRSHCKECGGSSICEHSRQRNRCRDCGGISICEHDRQRNQCKECDGASICVHNRERNRCRDCGGTSFCEHDRRRNHCKECDPGGHLARVVASRVYAAIKSDSQSTKTLEHLGCDIGAFKRHIELQFEEGMNWDNYGKWHIDHVVAIKYGDPTLEDVIERLHWTNTQPLWAADNIAKGNR